MDNTVLPRNFYMDNVQIVERLYTARELAKSRGISTVALNKHLKVLGVQYQDSSGNWLLSQDYRNYGYAKKIQRIVPRVKPTTWEYSLQWTTLGANLVHNLLDGVLP
jgi:phage antirepressor YoqD-like protein